MGQGRFTIGALKEIFRRPGYSAIVAYMPADLKDADEGRTAAQGDNVANLFESGQTLKRVVRPIVNSIITLQYCPIWSCQQ